VWMILPKRIERRERREFSHNSREKRGVGCRSTFSSSRRLKKAFKAGRKRAKTNSQKERRKRGQKSTQDPETVKEQFFWRESFIFPSKQKREKQQLLFLHESILKLVLSARSFEEEEEEEEEERGQREVFILVAEEVLLARAVGCFVLERKRERDFALVVEKSSPISEAAASSSSSSFAGQIFFLLSSSARTFKKRREK